MPTGPAAKRERKDEADNDDLIEEERLLTAIAPEDADQDTCKTFLFKGEGHTLGNALRFVIATYPEVLLCAYTMPHPAEDVMHFRIQTAPGILPQDMLQRGLHDLIKLSEVVIEKFEEAITNTPTHISEEVETQSSVSKNAQPTSESMTKKMKKTTISIIPSELPESNDDSDEDPECVDLE